MSFKCCIYSEIPNSYNLKYFIGNIDNNEEIDQSRNEFHQKILKTRYLIWKHKKLLAAPMPGCSSNIYIIASKTDVENGALYEVIKEHKIVLSGPFGLTNAIYQACITYSFSFRLSPLWNRICDTWIHSADFLTNIIPQPAVIWEPVVTENMNDIGRHAISRNYPDVVNLENPRDGALQCSLQALRVRIPVLDIRDYEVNLEELRLTGQASMTGVAFVLPQMKQCSLINIQTAIPPNCPFSNYGLMRKHWKNNYGIRLPHEESGMLYIQVCFRWNSEPYTYPSICVRPSKQQKLPARNPEEIISTFVQHMVEKCQNLCGKPLAFTPMENNINPLLKTLQEQNSSEAISRGHTTQIAQSQPTNIQKELFSDRRGNFKNVLNNCATATQVHHDKRKFVPVFKPRKTVEATISEENQNSKLPSIKTSMLNEATPKTVHTITKIVPQFGSRCFKPPNENLSHSLKGRVENKNLGRPNSAKLVKQPKARERSASTQKGTSVNIKKPLLNLSKQHPQPEPLCSPRKNLFIAKFVTSINKATEDIEDNILAIKTPAGLPTQNQNRQLQQKHNAKDTEANVIVSKPSTGRSTLRWQSQENNATHKKADQPGNSIENPVVQKNENVKSPGPQQTGESSKIQDFDFGITNLMSQSTWQPMISFKTSITSEVLEQILQPSKTTKAVPDPVGNEKKIRRSNPKTHDVESLAKTKLLSKANIPSLREFCKEHNILGFSKDKKEALIEKVYSYFNISFNVNHFNRDVNPQIGQPSEKMNSI